MSHNITIEFQVTRTEDLRSGSLFIGKIIFELLPLWIIWQYNLSFTIESRLNRIECFEMCVLIFCHYNFQNYFLDVLIRIFDNTVMANAEPEEVEVIDVLIECQKRRSSYTLYEKLKAIEKVEQLVIRGAARELKISRKNLQRWMKQKEIIKKAPTSRNWSNVRTWPRIVKPSFFLTRKNPYWS